jgi:hypothetical protein
MSASVQPFDLPAKIAAKVTETREVCRTIQDTLDSWIGAGAGFDAIACYWIEQHQGEKGRTVKRLRKSKDSKTPSGLRKRCVAFLESQFEQTGFTGKEINRALRLFALEKSAPWVQGLKSESKARELSALAAWHWEGCKLTREGERSIAAVKGALTDAGLEIVTRAEVREIVSGIIGRKKAKKNTARAAIKAFFVAMEGSEDGLTGPADRADMVAWLAVLLRESPNSAEILVSAVETHLEAMTAAEPDAAAA